MRQFYSVFFQIGTQCAELSHYRLLMRVPDEKALPTLFLCGRVCQIGLECVSAGAPDHHKATSDPGQDKASVSEIQLRELKPE